MPAPQFKIEKAYKRIALSENQEKNDRNKLTSDTNIEVSKTDKLCSINN